MNRNQVIDDINPKVRDRNRRPPPAVDPWSKRVSAIRSGVSDGKTYTAPLSEVLLDAKWALGGASQRFKEMLQKRGWMTPEALIRGWAKARRWKAVLDVENDLFIVQQSARTAKTKAHGIKHAIPRDPNQPSLFE